MPSAQGGAGDCCVITKAQAGYIHAPGSNVVCGDCVFLRDSDKCAWMGPKVTVSADHGSCNEFKQGDSGKVQWLEPYRSKIELGYMENRPGFGCRRCEEFKAEQQACKVVKKDSPGATPGRIDRFGCCNFWERDPKRGGMSDKQLVQILAAKPKVGTRLSELAGMR